MVEGIYSLKMNGEALLPPHKRSLCQSFVRLYRKTNTSDFIHKVAETFVTRILLIGIGLITSVIVARVLGPEGRGLYAVAASVGALGVQFGNLGLHASNTYHVAKDQRFLPALLANTLIVSFGLGGFIAAVTWMLFSIWPEWAPVQGILLGLSLTYIPFGLGYMLIQNLLLGIQKIREYNIVELANKVLVIGLVGLATILGSVNAGTVFSTGIIAMGICLILMIWLMKNSLSCFPLPSLSILKENIHYGIKVYLTDFFSFLALRMNLLIVQYMLGAKDAGYYSIAIALTDMVYMFPLIIGTLLFPKLAALEEDSEKWKLTKKMTYSVAFQMAGICGGIGVVAKPLVLILYGEAFIHSVPLFYLSLISVYFLSIQGILVKYMASHGYPSIIMWVWFSVLVIGLPMNVLFISVKGLIGVMYASIVTNFFLLLQITYFSIRYHKRIQLA